MPRLLLILLALSLCACSSRRSGGGGGDDDDSAPDDDDDFTWPMDDDDDATGDDDDVTWPDEAFLGYERDQTNNMTDQFNYMTDMWVRVQHGGVEETRTYTIPVGAYLAGPNGIPDGGAEDDELLGLVPGTEIVGTLSDWEPTEEPNAYPNQGYPSVHLPEGEPPSVVNGILLGGADGGEGTLELSHPTLGSVSTRLMVTPPDWCPNGVHEPAGGGHPGACQ